MELALRRVHTYYKATELNWSQLNWNASSVALQFSAVHICRFARALTSYTAFTRWSKRQTSIKHAWNIAYTKQTSSKHRASIKQTWSN